MENTVEKRQITVNLEENDDGESTLLTRVHPTLQTGREHIVHDAATESLEITDVGWDTDQIRPKDYAVDDVTNEDAWLLVRRFNKVRLTDFHSKHEANR